MAQRKTKPKRVLSGMRPTGRLHLGHFFGALSNWLNLQNARLPDGTEEYECFFFVADWHALTTHYEDTSSIAENTLQVAMDWLAVGLDPAKSTLFVQSSILEHAELHVLLSMITPLSWLERVPTYKEQIENLKDRDLGTYGFLGYPLLQSADIVIYDADFVPVGEDQVPHVEITREVVRLFNSTYRFKLDPRLFDDNEALASIGNKIKGVSGDEVPAPNVQYTPNQARIQHQDILDDHIRRVRFDLLRRAARESGYENFLKEVRPYQRYFPFSRPALREPQALLTETPRLPGTDGRRMAKSYGNAIWLSDSPEEVRAKVRNMMTDPQRQRRTDPGRPEVCPVFAYHKLFSPADTIAQVDRDCRSAAIGCVDCKGKMAENLVTWIEPVQARRKEFEARPQQVWDILDAGSDKARKAAKKTMRRVREAIFKWDEAK